jgi:hypothetical protein
MSRSCTLEEVTDSDKESRDCVVVVDSNPGLNENANEDLVRQDRASYSGRPSGDVAVMETNKAPILRTADRKDILRFQQKREKYIQVHLDAGLDPIRLRTLVSMIEQVLLETICQYEIGISFIEVTDKDLEEWMSVKLREDKSRDVLLDQKMGQLKMKMSIESAGARVLDLIVQFNRLVKENGWERLFDDPEGKKRQVKFLQRAIEPKGLRNMMGARVQREAHLSKDPAAFIKMLQEAAVYYQETAIYQGADSGAQPVHGKRQKTTKSAHTQDGRVGSEDSAEERRTRNPANKKLKCFSCGEVGHPAFKCPKKLTKQEVHDVLKKFNKNRKDSNYALVCSIGVDEDSSEVWWPPS